MTQYSTPELLVNECFEDIEQFSKAVRWNLDFRQIDPGPLNAKAILLGNEAILVLRFEFNRSFHQIGRPPEGLMTFGFPDKESGVLRWHGIETPPGVLINFNYETMLDCVTPTHFAGYVLSFKKESLSMAAEKLGLGPNFIDDLEKRQFWDPKGAEHHQLRQALQALEMVAVEEEFGVTPSKYIKSRRLAGVQSELVKIGSGAVISDVANNWGFWHMGSFASDYRKQFGELPSETLLHLPRQ